MSFRWSAISIASWLVLALFSGLTIPVKYPFEQRGQVLDSAFVVGLVVPLAVMTVFLDEGPPNLVACAGRDLRASRLLVCICYVLASIALAWTAVQIASLPSEVVLVDTTFLATIMLVGVSVLGCQFAWMPTLLVVGVFSAPGLIPFQQNFLYHRQVAPLYLGLCLAATLGSILAFTSRGAMGVPGRRSLRAEGLPQEL